MRFVQRLASAAACAALVCAPLVPAQASAPEREAAGPKFCNAKKYSSKVRKIETRQVGYATRVHTEAIPGRTVYKEGETRESSSTSNVGTQFKVAAGAEAEVGGKFPLVTAKVTARTEIEYANQRSSTKSESLTITNEKETVVRKATSIAWYTGHIGTKGTARVSYCDALEGSGEGYVKWAKVKFRLYSADTGSGLQRCDLRAFDLIAQAAKRNCR